MHKAPQLRSTFRSCDVEKVHATVAKSTFPSHNFKSTTCSDHFWTFRCRFVWQGQGIVHLVKREQNLKSCVSFIYSHHYTTTTNANTTSTSTKLRFTILHSTNYNYNYHYNCNYTTLHYIALIASHYTTLHGTPLHSTPLHYTTTRLHYNYTTLTSTTLHSTPLPLHNYTALHSTALPYTNSYKYNYTYNYNSATTLLYTTLHYTTRITPPHRQLQLRCTKYNTPQLQPHYTITKAALHHITSSSCGRGDRCNHGNHSEKHNSNHLSVHQWIRSAICDSQQPNSPIGFVFRNFRDRLVRYYWCIL